MPARRVSDCPVSAGVRCRTRLRWPTDVSASRQRRCGWKGRFLRQSAGSTLREAFVCLNCRFSTLGQDFVCRGKPSFNAPGPFHHPFQPFFNALGPRATSGARPTAASRRDSLPPLNAAGVVQALCSYSVSGADGRERYSGEGNCHPADGRKQAGFTPAVKRKARRAGPASVQRVRNRRAVASRMRL